MKLRMLVFALVFALILPVAAQAAEPRMISCAPCISYKRTTATCSVEIFGDNFSDEIEAIITLWYGSTIIASWERSSNGYLFFTETATVTPGLTYRLTVTYWVNGEQQTTAFTRGKCPEYDDGGASTVSIGDPLPEGM